MIVCVHDRLFTQPKDSLSVLLGWHVTCRSLFCSICVQKSMARMAAETAREAERRSTHVSENNSQRQCVPVRGMQRGKHSLVNVMSPCQNHKCSLTHTYSLSLIESYSIYLSLCLCLSLLYLSSNFFIFFFSMSLTLSLSAFLLSLLCVNLTVSISPSAALTAASTAQALTPPTPAHNSAAKTLQISQKQTCYSQSSLCCVLASVVSS